MRDKIVTALKEAKASGDKRRQATLRLVQAAINDRDTAARENGRDGVVDEEILDILRKMVRQRNVSIREFEEAGQIDLAEQERVESLIIREFLPVQINGDDMKALCEETVREINAQGLRDIGRCMSELKSRYPGKMDFVQASCVVKDLLRTETKD
ncbi:GatB/YqeY domain-containing protein [Roseibium algae]|uniref:GatB/YqeY domain-containing protein n=1 Tax=Roseibium algae TaxID=3123038 RepID=A0ABU8TEM4_9HYPH